MQQDNKNQSCQKVSLSIDNSLSLKNSYFISDSVSFGGPKGKKSDVLSKKLLKACDETLDKFNSNFEKIGEAIEHTHTRHGSPRTRKAKQVIHKYATSNTAISTTVGQVPFLDAPILAKNEAKMVKEIQEIYGINDENSRRDQIGAGVTGTFCGGTAYASVSESIPEPITKTIAKGSISYATTEAIGNSVLKDIRDRANRK